MSPRTRAAAAIAATLVTSVVLTPAPASAATYGTATYDCGAYGTSAQIIYSRPTTDLFLVTYMNPGFPGITSITTTLDGVSPGPSGPPSPTSLALSGPFATLYAAPSVVRFDYLSGTTLMAFITCTRNSGSQAGTWPV